MNLFDETADGSAVPRVPPQDLLAEQATLGSMLLEAEASERVLSILEDADFYREAHRVVYRAMQAVRKRREPVDLITVSAELRREGMADEVGGSEYLTAIIGEVPTTAHVVRYAGIIRDRSIARKLVALGMELAAAAYDNPAEPQDLLAEVIGKLTELEDRLLRRGRVKHFSELGGTVEVVKNAARERALWHQHRPHTNMHRIDHWTGGFVRPGLTVIRGYQKTGKSSLARGILRHETLDHGEHAILFGAEMTTEQTIDAMVKALSNFSLQDCVNEDGTIDEDALDVYSAHVSMVLQANLTHVDAHGMTVREVASQWVTINRDRPARLCVIDHFQRLSGATDSEPQTKAGVHLLTDTALDLNASCLLLSQETIMQDGRRSTKGGRVLEEEATATYAIRRIGETIHEGQTNPRAELVLEFSRDSPSTKWCIQMGENQTWALAATDEDEQQARERNPRRDRKLREDKRNE